MAKRLVRNALFSLYVLAASLAFGHSAAGTQCMGNKAVHGNHGLCSIKEASGALMAAVAAPFYWSWVLMERQP